MMRSYRLSIFIISLFSMLLYTGTLNNGFVYDDEFGIINNSFIKSLDNLPVLLQKEYTRITGDWTYRPVLTISYALDYAIFGLNPWGFHLTNILLHAVNSVLFFIFLTFLIHPVSLKNKEGSASSSLIFNRPLLISLLFAAHPVLTEAVNAISDRGDLLVFLFYIATLILYLIARADKRYSLTYIFSCLTFILALFSKEMAITLPLVVYCYELIYSDKKGRWIGQILPDKYNTGYIILAIVYAYLRFFYFHNPGEKVNDEWRLTERLLTMPLLFVSYLKLAIFPVSLCADYVIPPISTIFSFPFILSLLTIGFLLASAVALSKRNKEMAFGVMFFIITLIPVYNIIPTPIPFAERYLYLPTVGYAVTMGVIIIFCFYNLSSTNNSSLFIIAFPLMIIFSIATAHRGEIWNNDYVLWTDTVRKMPDSWRSHYNLANAYTFQGRLDDAAKEYKTAIGLKPNFLDSYVNLGVVYYTQGRLDEAVTQYNAALELDPNNSDAHNNLGHIYRKQGRTDDAIQEYRTVLRLNPDHIKGHYNLGLVYISKGLIDKARIEFETALKIKPDFLPARQALAPLLN